MTLTVAVLLACVHTPVSAVTLKPAEFSELVDAADWVVAARISSIQYEPANDPNFNVQQRILLDNVQVLQQRVATPQQFQVIVAGGILGKKLEVVPGAPGFKNGERVVLFLRDIGNGNAAILAHGMGVLRQAGDGSWLIPDISARNGPAKSGESFADFTKRLGLAGIEPKPEFHNSPSNGGSATLCIFALLLLASAILAASRRYKMLLAVAIVHVLAAIIGRQSHVTAAKALTRDYQLEGPKWDLKSNLTGRVFGGRVLWAQGQGSRSLSDSDTFATIGQQFQQWEDIPESAIAFKQQGQSADTGNAVDQRNIVAFTLTPSSVVFDKFTLAVTFTRSDSNGVFFIDSDTIFNDRDFVWAIGSGSSALEVVALHEIGHRLGLAHSMDTADVMYPIANGLRQLSPGDKAGAAFLYPVSSTAYALPSASPLIGSVPLTVYFASDGSIAGTGANAFSWDFGDGSPVSTMPSPSHTYTAPGQYIATLTVADDQGGTNTAALTVIAGNPAQAVSVSKFSFQAALASSTTNTKPNDKLSMSLSGLDLQPGDNVIYSLAGQTLTSVGVGGMPGDSTFGGVITQKLQHGLQTVSVSGASFLRAFDPRQPDDVSQKGTSSFPLLVLVERSSGEMLIYQTTIMFSYTIKKTNNAAGAIEKSIQGKGISATGKPTSRILH